jgi:hypothetical protein
MSRNWIVSLLSSTPPPQGMSLVDEIPGALIRATVTQAVLVLVNRTLIETASQPDLGHTRSGLGRTSMARAGEGLLGQGLDLGLDLRGDGGVLLGDGAGDDARPEDDDAAGDTLGVGDLRADVARVVGAAGDDVGAGPGRGAGAVLTGGGRGWSGRWCPRWRRLPGGCRAWGRPPCRPPCRPSCRGAGSSGWWSSADRRGWLPPEPALRGWETCAWVGLYPSAAVASALWRARRTRGSMGKRSPGVPRWGVVFALGWRRMGCEGE